MCTGGRSVQTPRHVRRLRPGARRITSPVRVPKRQGVRAVRRGRARRERGCDRRGPRRRRGCDADAAKAQAPASRRASPGGRGAERGVDAQVRLGAGERDAGG